MTYVATRAYGGISAEDRRSERRARLLEAGLDLLGTEGIEATTVRSICARAGLTPRYFYESFADRDDLLVALFDDLTAETTTAIVEAIAASPHDAHARMRAAVGALIDVLTDDPRKARAGFVEATGNTALTRRRAEALRGFSRLVGDQARDFYSSPKSADRLIDLTSLILVGGLAEALVAWLDGSLELGKDELVENVTDLFVATGEAAVKRSLQA